MDLSEIIYGVCHDWVMAVINPTGTEPADVVPVIQAYQDAPAPAVRYIAISGEPEMRRIGSARHIGSTDSDGDLEMVQDYQASVVFWEIGGHGDLLRRVQDSVDTQEMRDFFAQRNATFMTAGPIQSMPQLKEHRWLKESRWEVQLNVGVQVVRRQGWIETVELNNHITQETP